MALGRDYYIYCAQGSMIVSAPTKVVGFWVQNGKVVFRLNAEMNDYFHRLPFPFTHTLEKEPLEQLLQKIGPRIMQAVSNFQSGQREIFNFCINGGQWALELVDDSPALAYLVAHHVQQNTDSEDLYLTILRILAQKRRYVLAEMKWPSEKWVLKLLRKIPASQCSADMLHEIQMIITYGNSKKITALRHVPVLNHFVVELLADDELSPYLTNSFYEELAQASEEELITSEGLGVLFHKKALFEAVAKGFRFSPLKSLLDLSDLHFRFIEWLRTIELYENLKHVVFPSPPFFKTVIKNIKGEEFGVFPIENGADLWREGEEMNHCIAGYAQNIVEARGWSYAYHVKLPDTPPATLMIRSLGEGWFIGELKGKKDQEVSPDVELWVKAWLARNTYCELCRS